MLLNATEYSQNLGDINQKQATRNQFATTDAFDDRNKISFVLVLR
jgi:hypothetical protein